jgi:hypothetical protein
LLEILNCRNILKNLDQLDKFYLLVSIRNIHSYSDNCILLFTEKKSYKLLFNIIFNGIDQIVGSEPREEEIDVDDHGNIEGISISEDIPLEISNLCMSILANIFTRKQISKLILEDHLSKTQSFGVIVKSLNESDEWQDHSIF